MLSHTIFSASEVEGVQTACSIDEGIGDAIVRQSMEGAHQGVHYFLSERIVCVTRKHCKFAKYMCRISKTIINLRENA